MISTIVQILVAFPKLGSLFFKIRTEYVKELATRRHNKHRASIDEWVRNNERKQDSRVPTGTEQPRV